MQPFEIFSSGTQTSSNGITLDFGEDMLQAAVDAYDPALHEAPIVVGHPKDNHPAFGWIKALSYDEGKLVAEPDQVDPDFAELVIKGRYKKRSASFYLPDSPSNPKPGTLYLRHVGFLGAQPPAVKGLKGVEFNETEEGVVEFEEGSSSSWIWGALANAFSGMREWIIEDKGIDAADKVFPKYLISDLEAEAQRKRDAAQSQVEAAMPAIPSFSETKTPPDEDSIMLTPEQIQALQDENAALKAQAAQAADFAEKQADIEAREKALLRKEIEGKVDGLIAGGKVLPAHKSQLVDFMASLQDADTVVEFGEGDQAEKFSQRAFFEKFLADMPKAVEFGERAPREDGLNAGDMTDAEVAQKAVQFKEAQAEQGITISTTEAVAAVRAGKVQ